MPAVAPTHATTKGASASEAAPSADRPLRIHGAIPPELWNRVGTRLLPKLRAGRGLRVHVTFEVTADGPGSSALVGDLRQALDDLQLGDRVRIEDRSEE